MKFDNYKIRLNIKSCCMYEQVFGKNFMKMANAEDMFELMYCSVVTNNDSLLMTFDVFKTFANDVKVAKWIEREYTRVMEFNNQFKSQENGEVEKKTDDKVEELTMTDVASALIIRYGMDAHYVMYEMDLWEIQPYLNQADIKKKEELVSQRFWTYLTIAPHIDGKKIKKPQDLVPFDWEKESKEKVLDEVNSKAAFDFLTRGRIKEEKEE